MQNILNVIPLNIKNQTWQTLTNKKFIELTSKFIQISHKNIKQ